MISQANEAGRVRLLGVRSDAAGDGHYGAPRGTRRHNGVDLECLPNISIIGGVEGRVTKHGYCYGDDLTWRYVQVTDFDGLHHRFFYVDPLVPVGEVVGPATPLGVAQDITRRYPDQGMLPHVHYEVMTEASEHLDPTPYLG